MAYRTPHQRRQASHHSHHRPPVEREQPRDFVWPDEPSVTDPESYYAKYNDMELIHLRCAYCSRHPDVHRKAPYVAFKACPSENLKGLLKDVGIDRDIVQTLPKEMKITSASSYCHHVTIKSSELSYAHQVKCLKELVCAQIRTALDSHDKMSECKVAAETWRTQVMDPSDVGEVKVGQIHGLSGFGIPDTVIEKCQAVGSVNHMNGPLDLSSLPSFDWPPPTALLYMMVYYPDFQIGIARKSHAHGN
jgi:hypothetical protein